MERRILGGTGISVSEFTLGTMMFGAMGNPDHDESARMIHTALDAGINLVDTADVYSGGESEEIVGKALAGRRDEVVLATKFSLPMGPDANHRGGSRRWVMRAAEDSLRRLGTDHIDLYQMHRPDPHTDIDETLGALSDLVRAGKVLVIGSSLFPPQQIVEAQSTAQRGGHVRFRTEQPPYSILFRGIEAEMLPTAQRYGMGVLTFGPLSSGLAVRPGRPGQRAPGRRERGPARPLGPGRPGQAGRRAPPCGPGRPGRAAHSATWPPRSSGRTPRSPRSSSARAGRAPGRPAGRGRRHAGRGRPGRHRRDRPAGHDVTPATSSTTRPPCRTGACAAADQETAAGSQAGRLATGQASSTGSPAAMAASASRSS